MTNLFDDVLAKLEAVFTDLRGKLAPHVIPEVLDAAHSAVRDAEQQAKTIAGEAIKAATGDLASVPEVAVKVSMDAMQALGIPYNDVPADRRPKVLSDLPPALSGQPAAVPVEPVPGT